MSETRRWIRTARCEDIPLREGRSVKLGEREIAIFNLGDRFLAVAGHCPHSNGPLAEGIISGHSVVCPLHAWKVDLETGAVMRPLDTPLCVERFQVRVEDGIVLVELPTEASPSLESPGHYRDRQDVLRLMSSSCLQVKETETGNISA
jgi:nitrite reductase (NADH) small subunit